MPRRFVMGFDLGGGSVRCLLLDLAGGAPVVVSRGWPAFGGGATDLDLEAIFACLADATRAALARQSAVEAGNMLEQHRASPGYSAHYGIRPYWYL